MTMTSTTSFAGLLESFFTDRLMQQCQVSPHTIGSYRDTFRQFLKFVQQRLHKPPSRLTFEEIEAPLIVAFLEGLEKQHGRERAQRGICASPRSIPSFGTRRSRYRPAPPRSSGCSPFPASASREPWSRFLPARKSMPYWPRRISGTWFGRRDHAFHLGGRADGAALVGDDRAHTRGTSPSAPALTSVSSAKDARSAVRPSPDPPSPY